MENFIRKGEHDCWPWKGGAENAPSTGMDMACLNNACANPRHILGETVVDAVPTEQDKLLALQKRCLEAGIDFDGRWRLEKLQSVLDEAEKASE